MDIYENILDDKVDDKFKKNLVETDQATWNKKAKELKAKLDAKEITKEEYEKVFAEMYKALEKTKTANEDLDIDRGKEEPRAGEFDEEDHSEEGLIQDDEERAVAEFLRGYEASIENVLTQNLEAIMKKMTPQGFYFRGPAVINQIKKVTAAKLDQITREFYSQVKSQGDEPFDSTEEIDGIRNRKSTR